MVYAGYLLLGRNYRSQNRWLLLASYFFYGYWDWRFCSLLLISTLVDFYIGRAIYRATSLGRRRALLLTSLCTNLGILGFFKYFNFFADSAVELMRALGMHADAVTLNIVLPVGISFYTFQTLSYTIDIYRGKLRPIDDLQNFGLFVAFFPQLVAGPIERAATLLPQIEAPRTIRATQINIGLFLMVWGYFKKVVVADNLALIANEVFNHVGEHHGMELVVGVVAFAGQIYCDFSAYSDIARGLAMLMGFELMVNFRLPYFAATPSDFWQRWHISLSTWLRDYLYIPLGGNRHGRFQTMRNLMITMLLGGLWHGASWNFVLWGAFHGVLLALYRPFRRSPAPPHVPGDGEQRTLADGALTLLSIAVMFFFTLVGWVLFRCSGYVAPNGEVVYTPMQQMRLFFTQVIDPTLWQLTSRALADGYAVAFFAAPLVAIELWMQYKRDLLAPMRWPLAARVLLYGFLLTWIVIFGVREPVEFIYFQF